MSEQSDIATIRLPDKLIPVFEGEARYRGAHGGRGSGKTRSFALMTAVRAYQWAKQGETGIVLCGREIMNSLEDSSFAEVKSAIRETPWLDAYFECGEKFIRTKNNRISYSFSGLKHNIESIKSKSRILLCWVDEAEQVTEEAWRKLIPTVREDGSEVWVTWNPELKKSPTDVRFRQTKAEDMKIVELNYRDNPWFPKTLERERRADKKNNPDMYDHIWEGAYLEVVTGAYWGKQIQIATDEGRITADVPVLDSHPCITCWDIGNSDGTAIWVMQRVGMQYRAIDFYEAWGKPYSDAVRWLKNLGHVYEQHLLPHDADHRRQGQFSNKSPKEMLMELYTGAEFEVVPRVQDINWGIQQVRDVFPMLVFHSERCADGIDHLKKYRRKWSSNERRWMNLPDKSEGHSEAADALRQLAQAHASGLIMHVDGIGWDEDYEAPEVGVV